MPTLTIGYLFKKQYITYESQKYEIFEFVDYTTAIRFTNIENNEMCNITSGHNTGIYASVINKTKNEKEYVFIADNINEIIKENDNKVNFDVIRSKKIETTAKYYLRTDTGERLTKLVNEELVKYLNQNNQKNKLEFAEEVFEKNTDISDMYVSIKKTIISQDEQIMRILTTLFKNQTVVNSNLDIDLISKLKENILIYGSTGTGKTEILKRISKLYNIPMIIADTTSLSETGYVGRKTTDLLKELYQTANGNIKLAEKGILVLDEFDKIAEKSTNGQSHVSRLGVQRSLLKLLDGATFYFDDQKFNTSKLTIVALGAFTGITNGDDYKQLDTEDFMNYGIMRELIGRFSKTIAMNTLEQEDIIKILKNSDFSPINTYKKLFEILNINFEFTEDFIEYISQLAIAKKSGARSLKTVFDDCISSALFRIFAGEYTGITLVRPETKDEKPYKLTKKI